mgnify:CR=1 FL=1
MKFNKKIKLYKEEDINTIQDHLIKIKEENLRLENENKKQWLYMLLPVWIYYKWWRMCWHHNHRNPIEWVQKSRLLFGCLWLPFWCFLVPFVISFGSTTSLGEIFPRSTPESAMHVPGTFQEPAENPPYEPQAKLPFTLRLLRMDCVLRQTLRQNRRE